MAGNRIQKRAWTIAVLILLVMIVRVDIWWWGVDMPPVILGTFTVPMLYHLAIFLAGWALVLATLDADRPEGDRR
jgi:hypothetical protein